MKKTSILSLLTAALLAAPAMTFAADNSSYELKTADTHDTLISVGSVSKTFVSTAIMQLSDQGKIDIDAPVTDYIPEFRMADSRYKDITVRMLMDHTSGIMGTTQGDFMLFNDTDAGPHDNFLKELSTQRLKSFPGDFGAYCNDGFELLELIVERVSGDSFTDYMEKNICRPLGIKQTGTTWNVFGSQDLVKVFNTNKVEANTDYCLDLGSGGVISTAPELCRFGSLFFKGNNTILSEKAKKEMMTTSITDKYEDGFGLGFDYVDIDDYKNAGVKVVSKGGDITYQHAELLIAPDEEISVAVLSSGGSSMYNSLMAESLMDIALEEKGIKIGHSTPPQVQTVDEVPEKYLQYEDIYLSGNGIRYVSFPDKKYMQIDTLNAERRNTSYYMYTADDNFVLMDGNIQKGNAVPSRQYQVLSFRKRSGIDYIVSDSFMDMRDMGNIEASSYEMQRVGKNDISADVQASWDQRSGKKYYLYNGKYSNVVYDEMPCIKLLTSNEAAGYANDLKIKDSTHAESPLAMPGGRDIMDIEIKNEDGCEILDVTNKALKFISEDNIPELKDSVTEVEVSSKKAKWFRIGNAENRDIILDIPENAAVYVYDHFDRVTYSSYMKNYGNTVPLPKNGKIVFLGEDGGRIGIIQ